MPHLLNRSDAPVSENVWALIDNTAVMAAKSQLSVRRIVDVEGPYGLGVKSVPGPDRPTNEKTEYGGAVATVYTATPVVLPYIVTPFFISSRDVATYEELAIEFDASAVATAAIAAARQEDAILLYGSKEAGTQGLLTTKGVQNHKIGDWSDVRRAAGEVMGAVTQLDKAGFHGPYALALSPSIYNGLFTLNPDGQMTGYEHIRQFVTGGIVKAPALDNGGVLVATGRQFMSIAIGQDFAVGFVGPAEGGFQFTITESIALRLRQPAAVTVLKTA